MIVGKRLKILIVDDEKEIVNSISEYFSQFNTECTAAHNLLTGINYLTHQVFDFVLLDLNLPDGNGYQFLEEAERLNYKGNIIIISGNNSVIDIVTGLNKGSDEYFPKPFSLPILAARIKNLYRSKISDPEDRIIFHEIVLNPKKQKAYVNNSELELTRTEFDLLLFFVNNAKNILTRETIGKHLYRNKYDIDNSFDFIYSHIKNLKKKISEFSSADYFKTIYGIGYMFSVE